MRSLNQKLYSVREVSNVPVGSKQVRFNVDPQGKDKSYQTFHVYKKGHTYRLYVGSTSPISGEPLFKVRHKFYTKAEAVFYAQYLTLVQETL